MMNVSSYPDRESKNLEFKEVLGDYHKMIKTIVAFANGVGGTLIVGVADKSRRIVGVSEDLIDKYFEELPQAVYQMVTPHLMVYPFEKNVGGQTLFCINVYSGDNKPYYITSEGITRGVYVRVGAHTMRANHLFIEELKLQKINRSYDETLCHTLSPKDLNYQLIQESFHQKLSDRQMEAHRILGRDHVSGQLLPTVGGVVMFHPKPSEVISETSLVCTRMKGTSGRHIIETHDFEGPLPQLAETALHQLEDWLERDLKLSGPKLRGKLLVPREALREGLLNALLHRKYNIPGAVKVTLWSDRLEIFSPGQFVGLMPMESLGDGTTYIRNRVISSLARKIKLMEKRGTGIRLIFDSCRELGGVAPSYEEGADWVRLTFRFLTSAEKESVTVQDRFQELLTSKKVLTRREVVAHCGVSAQTAVNMLSQQVKVGTLRLDGKGRATKYWVISNKL